MTWDKLMCHFEVVTKSKESLWEFYIDDNNFEAQVEFQIMPAKEMPDNNFYDLRDVVQIKKWLQSQLRKSTRFHVLHIQ